MKTKLFGLALLSIFLLVGFASASVSISGDLTASTLPSDDIDTKTITINFNVTSTEDITVTSSITGLSDWNPSISPSVSLINESVKPFILTLNVPKYIDSSLYTGDLFVGNGTSNNSAQVSIIVEDLISLRVNPSSLLMTKSINSVLVEVKNDGNQVITGITASIVNNSIRDSEDNSLSLSLTPSGTFTLIPGQNKILNISYSVDPDDIDLVLGRSSTRFLVSSSAANASSELHFENDFCEFGEVGGNDVEIISVTDETSSNGNFKWALLENVEVEVEVRNNMEDDEDITIELIIYDEDEDNEIYSEEIEVFVEEDERESVLFSFILPADTPEDAKLYVKAYLDEDEQCDNSWGSRTSETIKLDSKENFDVGITEVELESTLLCGEVGSLSLEAHNIGKKDQDRVLVSVFNNELGIDEELTIFNLDEGEDDRLSFNLQIPQDAEEKTYQLEIEARHDYDKRNDDYDDVSDRILKSFSVEGGCIEPLVNEVLISPSLSSDAIAGEDLVIKTSLRNLGSDALTVTVTPFSYEEWASLSSVQPSAVTLLAGESRDVTITLKVNEGISGEQRFKIRAMYGTQMNDQEVSVFIQSSAPNAFFDSIRENWVIWVIVIANIILILAIIIAAIKLSRK